MLSDSYNLVGLDDSVLSVSKKGLALAKLIEYREGVAKMLYNLAWGYFGIDQYSESLTFAEESHQIYMELGNVEEATWCNDILISYQRYIGNIDSAYHLAIRQYEDFENLGSTKGMASALLYTADVEILRSNDEKALDAILRALKLYEGIDHKWGIGHAYGFLGEFYRLNEEYPLATKYFRMQFNLLDTFESDFGIVEAYTGLGNVYLETKNYDSALHYFSKSLEIDERINFQYGKGIDYNNLAEVYRRTDRHEEALFNYEQSLQICYTIGDIEGSIYPLEGMGVICKQLGEYDKATKYFLEARQVEERLGLHRMLVDNYLHQAELDSAKGSYGQAYRWMKKRSALSDSLYNKDKLNTIAELQTRFDTEKKDQEIKFLSEEKELIRQQRSKEKMFLLTLLTSLAIIILALTYIVFNKIRTGRILGSKNSQIAEKNEELNLKNEELEKLAEVLESKNKDLAVKNEKLEDLNREKDGLIGVVAHDLRGPISKTFGLVNLLRHTGELSKQQEEVVGLIEKVCKDGNSLIKDLLEINRIEAEEEETSSFINIDLLMSNMIREFETVANRKNILISMIGHEGEKNMLTKVGSLTRILDNIISNAIKFSNANKSVLVHYHSTEDQFVFSVTDQGPGISEDERVHLYKKFKRLSAKPTGGESSSGLGLSIAKMLVEKLGGSISVESKVGAGSTFTVQLPCKTKKI